MTTRRVGWILTASSLGLAGCATIPPAQVPQAPAFLTPPVYTTHGLERVLGRNAASLVALLGEPDLDIREAKGRKLQFSGPICVLDAYLYPPASGGEAVVTYIDARQPDGRDIDRASCVAALASRQAR